MYTPSNTLDCGPVDEPGSCANNGLKSVRINDMLKGSPADIFGIMRNDV